MDFARFPVRSALSLVPVLLAVAALSAATELRYRLETPDGVPGAVRVEVRPDRPGAWRAKALWTGRGLATFRLEDRFGTVLVRQTGSSPLELAFTVTSAGVGAPLTLRFATLTDRGPLAGELEVVPPTAVEQAPPAAPLSPVSAVHGPGACLAPAFGEDPAGRAVLELARSLQSAPEPALAWCAARVATLAGAAGEAEKGRVSRAALDRLWDEIAASPSPDPAVGAAYRQVLAVIENFARREDDGAKSARARRDALVDTLRCLEPGH